MYLTVTIIINDQMIKDKAPSRSSLLGGSVKVDENT